MPTASHKKLIEVSIPLVAINKEALRRKQKAPKGYPTAIHKYWAQRPIALCRAVLFAQLVDDPSSCPEEFPTTPVQNAERERLHDLIRKLVPWEASNDELILNAARYEIARSLARGRGDKLPPIDQMKSTEIDDYLLKHAPPVCDPFSGGGSIPLEAQRLGLTVNGSDLNPLAVLIGKALVEFPPKFAGRRPVNPEVDELRQWRGGQGLAEDVRYYGRWMRAEAEKRIGHLYPNIALTDGKPLTVIAWLWARTVRSPDPRAKGAHVPLVSSFVLSSKSGKEVIVKPVVDRAKMTWRFEIDDKPGKTGIETAKTGTKAARGANFVCLLTGSAIDDKHVKSEAKTGQMDSALMAIVADSEYGRIYLAPTKEHARAAQVQPPEVPEVDQPLPDDPRNFWTVPYGIDTFAKLFTPRQLLALTTFSDLVMEACERVLTDAKKHWSGAHADDTRRLSDGGLGSVAYADAVATYLAFVLDRMVSRGSALCKWLSKDNAMGETMPKQALAMSWDFAEGNPMGKSSSDVLTCCRAIADCIDATYARYPATITLRDAQLNKFEKGSMVSTDPPYYDNVGYADLSDFFYVWLRRTLLKVHPDLFRRVLTPKANELVATPYRHGGKDEAEQHFMEGMKKALLGIANGLDGVPAAIYYAYKQQEVGEDALTSPGWASFLQAVVNSGLSIDGTWPVRSESEGRSIAMGTNALASSIVLVCRRREVLSASITRSDFLRSLRREMPAALTAIRHAGVGPTDIQQAAIGPGIGIFTRYTQVLNTDGTPMLVRDALKLINQVREEITSHGDADYDSETRFALDWFAAKAFGKGKAGDAITMTNAVDVSLNGMNAAGFFEARGGDARLLTREELPDDWDPAKDARATVWEACQHLIKRLQAENGGVDAAAMLYSRLGSLAEPAHALARRLYDICEQKQWANEGYAYNQLHQEWETIEKRAAALAKAGERSDLFSRRGLTHERT
jgi:putative DNA methylase